MRFVSVRLVTLLLALAGGVNIVTALRPHARLVRLAAPIDGAVPGRAQAFVIGVLLLAAARGLAGGRYVAYLAATVVLALATVVAVPHRPGAVVLAGGSLAALVANRAAFRARPDPARLRLAGQIGLVALVAALVGGGWDAVANRRAPGGAGRVVVDDLSTGTPATWGAVVLTLTVAGALLAAVLVALAPAPPPAPGGHAERAEAGALAGHPDADSLAPFVTRADKSYVFSPDRQAAIGYRVVFGTALAGGDPVGAARSAPAAVDAFVALCATRGWRPGVFGASGLTLPHWHRHGLRGMRVGDEAVLAVATFNLASRRMRNVRQAVNRTRNAGVTVSIAALTAAHAADLAPVLDEWLDGAAERGFSMNLDAILTPRPGCLVATAYAADGRPVAFARFAVCAAGDVYTLDVAPRRRRAPGGVVERLIVEVVGHARTHGAGEVSLNFAAVRGVFAGRGTAARTGAALLRALDRWIEIAPLNRFCAKFDPHWRPRSLLAPSWWQFGWVAAAVLRAELGTRVRSAQPVPARSGQPVSAWPDPAGAAWAEQAGLAAFATDGATVPADGWLAALGSEGGQPEPLSPAARPRRRSSDRTRTTRRRSPGRR